MKFTTHSPYLITLAFVTTMSAQAPLPAPNWAPLQFLTGDWVADEGGGVPGQARGGGYSFRVELQGRVLVRRSFADYPVTKDQPAFRHEDLMILSADAAGKPSKAVFYDSEGHVIHYTVNISAEGGAVIFVSDPQSNEPRYRLSYRSIGKGRVEGQFEIAPPGKPDAFSKYLQWTAHQTKP